MDRLYNTLSVWLYSFLISSGCFSTTLKLYILSKILLYPLFSRFLLNNNNDDQFYGSDD